MNWKINEYKKYAATIRDAEKLYNIPEDLLARILYQESKFDADVIAGKGRHKLSAIGIAGFMPNIRGYGLMSDNGEDLRKHPIASIFVAARYLRDLHNLFNEWKPAIMAFQWGIENVLEHRRGTGKHPAPIKTSEYVAQITADVPC